MSDVFERILRSPPEKKGHRSREESLCFSKTPMSDERTIKWFNPSPPVSVPGNGLVS